MGFICEEYRTMRDGLRYGFAVGKVRVLATRVLDRLALERLVDATSFAEQKRILSEGPYGRFLEAAETPAEVEAAIDASQESAYEFLDKAGLPSGVARFFRLRYDYANLKAALKAAAVGAGLDGLLAAHGTVSPALFEGALDRLPEPLGRVAAEVASRDDARASGEAALMKIDATVDRAMFAELKRVASETGSELLVRLSAHLVDFANVKILLRAARIGFPTEAVVSDLLIDGGLIARDAFARIARQSATESRTTLELRLHFAPGSLSGEDGADLDLAIDNALVAAVRRASRPEPGADDVIAYVLTREAEAQMLRVALLGKMAGLDSAALHRRMRASFR